MRRFAAATLLLAGSASAAPPRVLAVAPCDNRADGPQAFSVQATVIANSDSERCVTSNGVLGSITLEKCQAGNLTQAGWNISTTGPPAPVSWFGSCIAVDAANQTILADCSVAGVLTLQYNLFTNAITIVAGDSKGACLTPLGKKVVEEEEEEAPAPPRKSSLSLGLGSQLLIAKCDDTSATQRFSVNDGAVGIISNPDQGGCMSCDGGENGPLTLESCSRLNVNQTRYNLTATPVPGGAAVEWANSGDCIAVDASSLLILGPCDDAGVLTLNFEPATSQIVVLAGVIDAGQCIDVAASVAAPARAAGGAGGVAGA